jgi:hypothetical protein
MVDDRGDDRHREAGFDAEGHDRRSLQPIHLKFVPCSILEHTPDIELRVVVGVAIDNDGLAVRIGTGAILLAFSAGSLICVALAPLSENWRIATYTLSILSLAAIWTATIAIVWGDA